MKKLYAYWIDILSYFGEHYPALYFACFFLLGMAGYFSFFLALLSLPLLIRKHLAKNILFMSCGFFFFQFHAPPSLKTPLQGSGIFQIHEIKKHVSPFNSCLVYEGTLKSFQTAGKALHRLPCRIYSHQRKNHPQADQDYLLTSATLIETAPHRFVLKPQKKTPWIPIKKSHSLAEKRFQLKEKTKSYLHQHYKTKREHALMTALLTGNLENRLLAFQFGQVGLQHLLAISGFHFALLSFFLLFLLRRFFSSRAASALLLILLTVYFLYMGSAPSISRAWIGVFIFLIGTFFHYRPTALNALGIALFAALISDPLVLFQIGFQLSFAATLGILLFYAPFEKKLQLLLPKRSYQEATQLNCLDQWGYLLAAYLRNVLALNGAVLMFILPLLLFHFQKFPLISLAYNLFFPLLFSVLIALLFLALLFPPLHLVSNLYASFVLDLVTYAPKRLMFYLRVPEFPLGVLVIILLGVYIGGIQSRFRKRISLK